MMKKYFYGLLSRYLSLYIHPNDHVVEIDPRTNKVIRQFSKRTVLIQENSDCESMFDGIEQINNLSKLKNLSADYILLSGNLHYERDIQFFLKEIYANCQSSCRLIIVFYSSLWKPLLNLATILGLRKKTPEMNWLAPQDIQNLLILSDFEPICVDGRILIPFYIPIVSMIVNKYLAPLPFFRLFVMANIMVAKPLKSRFANIYPSVSVVVAARNESGNIEQIVKRLPRMGPDDELIFVEGHSTDDTWKEIQRVSSAYLGSHHIICVQQDGIGKGDAIRKGFDLASKEILMILDADLTVSPEDLPKFYEAIKSGKGEFINGSRLVYPMERKAMRFINMLGNKFFAFAFSFILGQRFKDTLCGTKVISRDNYKKIAAHRSFFGEFDPFGDFDLIFGASRMGLKIIEVPIVYKERAYGKTNISRWKHGALLMAMASFAAKKFRFI